MPLKLAAVPGLRDRNRTRFRQANAPAVLAGGWRRLVIVPPVARVSIEQRQYAAECFAHRIRVSGRIRCMAGFPEAGDEVGQASVDLAVIFQEGGIVFRLALERV